MEENLMVEQPTTPVEPEEPTTEEPVVEDKPVEQEKTYTKAEVQALMKRRVDRSHNRVWGRYGVKSFEELDDMINDYRSIKDNYASLEAKNNELMRDLALLRNNTLPEKKDDIIAYFKGNNLDLNEENLISALATHPEWVKQAPLKIEKIGAEQTNPVKPDEKEAASRYFGVKL